MRSNLNLLNQSNKKTMTRPNNPAFPAEDRSNGDMPDGNYFHSGLTKREYFAVMVMSGIMAMDDKSIEADTIDEGFKLIAEASVKAADYLIEALNK
jgi:hypothetical protein